MPGLGKISLESLKSDSSDSDDESEDARERVLAMGREIQAKRMMKAIENKSSKEFAAALQDFLDMRF